MTCARRRCSKTRPYRNTMSKFERWRKRESYTSGRQANQALARCHRLVKFDLF